MVKSYTANYTKIDSGYMGQIVEWPIAEPRLDLLRRHQEEEKVIDEQILLAELVLHADHAKRSGNVVCAS